MTPNEQTLSVYSQIADSYRKQTEALDTQNCRQVLTDRLRPGARILDAGCGWGRDARAFADAGFAVTAFDGCPELAAQATAHLGAPVQTLRFQDFSADSEFDGVWARASLLHLERLELKDALHRLVRALKRGGWMYTCFKSGANDGFDSMGRYFSYMTVASFCETLGGVGATLKEHWPTADQFGRAEGWLNFIVQRD